MRRPRGFTLIETLVALILFAFAMLALAAGTGVVARDLGKARRTAEAITLAGNRVERLAQALCPTAGQGEIAGAVWTEHWRIEAAGRRRVISDSVVFATSDGRTAFVVARIGTLCPS